jgi:hypothetical protein
MEITKFFTPLTPAEVTQAQSVDITWEELLPYMKNISRLRDGEVINAIITSDAGMKIILGKKYVRKAYKKKEKVEEVKVIKKVV